MVEITPLPGEPEFVRGVINVQGEIMPVIDLRKRFGLAPRPVRLGDQLIITRFSSKYFALMADAAEEVRECEGRELTEAADILPGLPFLTGVAKLPDGMILIHDPAKLLSLAEHQALDEAVGQVEL